MRQVFVGLKSPHVGKTLWEIVSNLKNFGVGRLVINTDFLKYPEPCFLKIVKVQPLASPTQQYVDREVMVWFEEVYRGRKLEVLQEKNNLPRYSLVPKCDEEKYYKLAEEYATKDVSEVIPKYIDWPPLYKEIWKKRSTPLRSRLKGLPKIETMLQPDRYSIEILSETDELYPKLTSDLYRDSKMSVEDMIREIAELEKIVGVEDSEESTT